MNPAMQRSIAAHAKNGVRLELLEVLDVSYVSRDITALRHKLIIRLRRKHKSVRWIAGTLGITENTVHGVLRERGKGE
jgi:DNA invertase Pin-like site-specific DNA recombinase